jgi:hypothetical protein
VAKGPLATKPINASSSSSSVYRTPSSSPPRRENDLKTTREHDGQDPRQQQQQKQHQYHSKLNQHNLASEKALTPASLLAKSAAAALRLSDSPRRLTELMPVRPGMEDAEDKGAKEIGSGRSRSHNNGSSVERRDSFPSAASQNSNDKKEFKQRREHTTTSEADDDGVAENEVDSIPELPDDIRDYAYAQRTTTRTSSAGRDSSTSLPLRPVYAANKPSDATEGVKVQAPTKKGRTCLPTDLADTVAALPVSQARLQPKHQHQHQHQATEPEPEQPPPPFKEAKESEKTIRANNNSRGGLSFSAPISIDFPLLDSFPAIDDEDRNDDRNYEDEDEDDRQEYNCDFSSSQQAAAARRRRDNVSKQPTENNATTTPKDSSRRPIKPNPKPKPKAPPITIKEESSAEKWSIDDDSDILAKFGDSFSGAW